MFDGFTTDYLEQEKGEMSHTRKRRYLPLSLMGPISTAPGVYNALALAAAKQHLQSKQPPPHQQQARPRPPTTVAPDALNATAAAEAEQEIIPDTTTASEMLNMFKDLFSYFRHLYFSSDSSSRPWFITGTIEVQQEIDPSKAVAQEMNNNSAAVETQQDKEVSDIRSDPHRHCNRNSSHRNSCRHSPRHRHQ